MRPGDTVKALHSCSAHVVVEAPNGDVYCSERIREGSPLTPGGKLVTFERTGHTSTLRVASVTDVPGPARVTSDRYRKGWDRVFARETGREVN